MRIFVRTMMMGWIIMLILTAALLFWPAATGHTLDNRRTIPMPLIEACAESSALKDAPTHSFASIGQDPACPTSRLVAPGNGVRKDLSGNRLSQEEMRTVALAFQSHSTAIHLIPDGTVVALPAVPGDPRSPIYVATLRLPERSYLLWHLNQAGRLIFMSGLLSIVIAAYFVAPITRLRRVAEQFGTGDLKARVATPLASRKDELGDLGRTFNEMAERIESMVIRYRSFLAHASHELGSPITRLNIALALARRKATPELESEHSRIRQEADRLNALVQELLLLARLESGNEVSRQLVDFQVGSLVQEAFENAAIEANERGKTVSIVMIDNYSLSGYPDLLLRAVDNILRNALRFAIHEIRIHLQLIRSDETNTGILLIEDDGPGISPEDQEAIFEPFFTGNETPTSEVPHGSGLGLAIARQAVIANRGTISARRSSLGGLAVVIELPTQHC